jgi:hypothetical protein
MGRLGLLGLVRYPMGTVMPSSGDSERVILNPVATG